MLSWIRRNSKKIAAGILAVILALFGSIRDALVFILAFFPGFGSPNVEVLQVLLTFTALIVAFLLGMSFWNWRRSSARKTSPEIPTPSSNDHLNPPLSFEVRKSNFRNQVSEEVRQILDQLDGPVTVPSRIGYQVWRSKSDAEKIELLGDDDYRSIKPFYDAIEKSNQITQRTDQEAMENAMNGTSFQAIFGEAQRVASVVKWLDLQKPEVRK